VQCKDGVILASEKLMMSKMLVDSTCKVVHKVDDQIGVVSLGPELPLPGTALQQRI
tara:strand:- start:47 stop:214 length:168 start_codon:yes stop_codon:yes gene_type:complete